MREGIKMTSGSTREFQDLTDSELIRQHWKAFGIWMGMRNRAKKNAGLDAEAMLWGKVHRYAERVLDPMAFEMERRGLFGKDEEQE
jgi:hypothetical protein